MSPMNTIRSTKTKATVFHVAPLMEGGNQPVCQFSGSTSLTERITYTQFMSKKWPNHFFLLVPPNNGIAYLFQDGQELMVDVYPKGEQGYLSPDFNHAMLLAAKLEATQ